MRYAQYRLVLLPSIVMNEKQPLVRAAYPPGLLGLNGQLLLASVKTPLGRAEE